MCVGGRASKQEGEMCIHSSNIYCLLAVCVYVCALCCKCNFIQDKTFPSHEESACSAELDIGRRISKMTCVANR